MTSSPTKEPESARRAVARRAIGAQVRSERRKAGLTQADLSALSGIGINTITRCERGSIAVTLDTLDRMAEVLRCDLVVAAAPMLPELPRPRKKARQIPAPEARTGAASGRLEAGGDPDDTPGYDLDGA